MVGQKRKSDNSLNLIDLLDYVLIVFTNVFR